MVSHHRNNRKMENLNLLKSDIIKKFGITASHHIGNLENPILKSNLWFLVRNPTSYILKDSPMGNFVQNTYQRERGKKKSYSLDIKESMETSSLGEQDENG